MMRPSRQPGGRAGRQDQAGNRIMIRKHAEKSQTQALVSMPFPLPQGNASPCRLYNAT